MVSILLVCSDVFPFSSAPTGISMPLASPPMCLFRIFIDILLLPLGKHSKAPKPHGQICPTHVLLWVGLSLVKWRWGIFHGRMRVGGFSFVIGEGFQSFFWTLNETGSKRTPVTPKAVRVRMIFLLHHPGTAHSPFSLLSSCSGSPWIFPVSPLLCLPEQDNLSRLTFYSSPALMKMSLVLTINFFLICIWLALCTHLLFMSSMNIDLPVAAC